MAIRRSWSGAIAYSSTDVAKALRAALVRLRRPGRQVPGADLFMRGASNGARGSRGTVAIPLQAAVPFASSSANRPRPAATERSRLRLLLVQGEPAQIVVG